MREVLVATSVASMIKQFTIPNIQLLKELGYIVTVATNFSEPGTIPLEQSGLLKKQLNEMGVLTYDIPFSRSPFSKDNIKSYKVLKDLIDSNNYEFIHCHSPVGGAITRLASKESRNHGTKVIYTAHGFHFYKGAPIINWLLFYPAERLLAKITDVLITINQEDFERAQTFDAKKTHYIPGIGIKLELTAEKAPNIKKVIDGIEIDEDSFIIVSVGELNKNKNHQIALKALSLVDKEFDYIIIGEGPELIELKKLTKSLKLDNKVHFLGYRNDVKEILLNSDLFLFPSYREGLSLSLMEAMSVGLPAVVSQIRGNVDLIDPGKGGYTFNQHDEKELSKILENMLQNPEQLQKFGEYNLEKINYFSENNVLNKLKEIYMKNSKT